MTPEFLTAQGFRLDVLASLKAGERLLRGVGLSVSPCLTSFGVVTCDLRARTKFSKPRT